MKKTLILPLLFLAASSCSGPEITLEPDDVQDIQQRAETYIRSMHTGEAEKVASLTNPRFLIRIGGAKKLQEAVRAGSARLRGMGLQVESVSFPEPLRALQGSSAKDLRFAIVPMVWVTTQKGGSRTEFSDFVVAINETSPGTWTILEGEKARQGAVHDLYPGEFSSDFTWAKAQKRSL